MKLTIKQSFVAMAICTFFIVLRTLPWVEHILAHRRSCLPCTTLPYSHTAAYPQGIRHSMCRAYSSEWGLFGRNTRSAFRRTPSRKMQPILQTLVFFFENNCDILRGPHELRE